jgi:hypothetical protein
VFASSCKLNNYFQYRDWKWVIYGIELDKMFFSGKMEGKDVIEDKTPNK